MDLTHHFLIAMPSMVDTNFAKSLTYICEHNEQGALGVVVNRPIEMTLRTLFEQIDIPLRDDTRSRLPVYFGGPVQVDRGFVLHRPPGDWESTLSINAQVGLTTSRDILQAVGEARASATPGFTGLRWLGPGATGAGAKPERVAHGRRRSGRDFRAAGGAAPFRRDEPAGNRPGPAVR